MNMLKQKSGGPAPAEATRGAAVKVGMKKSVKSNGGENKMYKEPKAGFRAGKVIKNASSSQSTPNAQPSKIAKTYKGVSQPIQYSNANGPKPTKFVS